MKVSVDQDFCVGTGACVEEAPDVFTIDDAGVASAVTPVHGGSAARAMSAAGGCPANAIAVRPDGPIGRT